MQGLTIYKALKESNAKPGQWVSISGAGGGLGHLGGIQTEYCFFIVKISDLCFVRYTVCCGDGTQSCCYWWVILGCYCNRYVTYSYPPIT